MRVLIAPDKFAGTLSAAQAAEAIATGWARTAPDDVLDLAPMSDGGPGFVEVLQASLGGELLAATCRGPYGDPTPGAVLVVDEIGYVESAQACGLHLCDPDRVEEAGSVGVADLVLAAVAAGCSTVVVGLGGSGSNDGGAGFLHGLGVRADVPLDGGVSALDGISVVELGPVAEVLGGVNLVLASDVDNPLTGLFGATRTYGPQKGVTEQRLPVLDGILEQWAEVCGRRIALDKGAGAAGGLGYALLLLGATREPGIALVADAVDLAGRAALADLVVTGEGAFDFSSRAGKVPFGVAEVATAAARPCVALAGQVHVGAREMRALGIESGYSMLDLVGRESSFERPVESLAALAERVARSWTRGVRE